MTNYDELITDDLKDQLEKILTDDELKNLLKKIEKKKMKLKYNHTMIAFTNESIENESESDDEEKKSEFEEFDNEQKK
ncbi:MAG: hypothetical protein M1836_002477 [Candelina mexicana]|nr:MAG: hypothetical protein M1836_002477 [Candelina mexicana]